MVDYAQVRRNMVESQLRANGVTDPAVTAAFLAVPREAFVPPAQRAIAYVDEDLSVKPGRYLMEPMVFGKLVRLAGIHPDDRVLHVGCGVGYGSAVLGRLAAAVIALEEDPELAAMAEQALAETGTENVRVVTGPLADGLPGEGPYDVVFVEGAVDVVPPALQEQVAKDGGRLVAVVRDPRGVGHGTLFLREHGVLSDRPDFDASTPLLPGFARRPSFVF